MEQKEDANGIHKDLKTLQVMPEPQLIAGFLKRKLAHKLLGFLNLTGSPGKHDRVGGVKVCLL